MQRFKWEGYKSIEETVQEMLGPNDRILLEFEALPLDYKVEDINSPKFFVTRNRLVFVYDSMIEVYNLREIGVLLIGGEPSFSLVQQALEYRPDYVSSKTPLSKNLDLPDDFLRFAIKEQNVLQKEFVLRKGDFSAKSYQTWAFARYLKNLQFGKVDYRLSDMVAGSFSFFDGIFLVGAFLIFIFYVFITVLFGSFLPEFLIRVIDFLFYIVCIGVLGWILWTVFVNMRGYRRVYEKYKVDDMRRATENTKV